MEFMMLPDRKIADDQLKSIPRVELIDETGRCYVNFEVNEVQLHLQDNDKTLKVFIRSDIKNSQQ